VILGGLISSTLLDFLVHPALFWCFGKRDAEEQQAKGLHDELDDEFFDSGTAAGMNAGESLTVTLSADR
jgi:hypothetical protein